MSVAGGQGRLSNDRRAEFSKSASSRDQASNTSGRLGQERPRTVLIPKKSIRISMSLGSHTRLLLKLWRR